MPSSGRLSCDGYVRFAQNIPKLYPVHLMFLPFLLSEASFFVYLKPFDICEEGKVSKIGKVGTNDIT